MISVSIERVAIYNITGLPVSWGWCKLHDVSKAIRRPPFDVWAHFFHLTKDLDQGILPLVVELRDRYVFVEASFHAPITGVNAIRNLPEQQNERDIVAREIRSGNVYVPAGWANRVLKVTRAGIWRVVLDPSGGHAHHDPFNGNEDIVCPEGTINCCYDGFGFVGALGYRANGELFRNWAIADAGL